MSSKDIHNKSLRIERQCVAFTRHWLYINKGLIYDDVDIAADIWDKVNYYIRASDGKTFPVSNIENGSSHHPLIGDLIIYSEKYLTTGHVAVVTAIDESNKSVWLNEQNFDNQYRSPYQERSIPLVKHEGNYWLLDNHLIGWKHLKETS